MTNAYFWWQVGVGVKKTQKPAYVIHGCSPRELIHIILSLQIIWHLEYHMLNWNTLSVKPTLALNTINVLPYNIYNINFLEFLLLQYQTILWGKMNTYYMQSTLLFSSIISKPFDNPYVFLFFRNIAHRTLQLILKDKTFNIVRAAWKIYVQCVSKTS